MWNAGYGDAYGPQSLADLVKLAVLSRSRCHIKRPPVAPTPGITVTGQVQGSPAGVVEEIDCGELIPGIGNCDVDRIAFVNRTISLLIAFHALNN